jgi:hypothetical protein
MKVFSLLLSVIPALLACGHPSDQELIERFEARQEKFDALLRMYQEDSTLLRVTPDFTIPKNSLSAERWAEYRDLFDDLGLDGGLSGRSPGPTIFFASTRGFVTGGDVKGYAYSEAVPGRLLDSLDRRPSDSESNVPVYRRITNRWYLYYSWDD